MQIIIDISENLYEAVINGLDAKEIIDLRLAIKNGTPLPKCHGRLIDENDLSLMTVHMIDGALVCDAQTIIEADKAESSETIHGSTYGGVSWGGTYKQ